MSLRHQSVDSKEEHARALEAERQEDERGRGPERQDYSGSGGSTDGRPPDRHKAEVLDS